MLSFPGLMAALAAAAPAAESMQHSSMKAKVLASEALEGTPPSGDAEETSTSKQSSRSLRL